jgi:hypothetical protein
VIGARVMKPNWSVAFLEHVFFEDECCRVESLAELHSYFLKKRHCVEFPFDKAPGEKDA